MSVVFLFLHVVGAVGFGNLMKWAQRRGAGLVAVGAINYLLAALGALAWHLLSGAPPVQIGTVGFGLLCGVGYVVSMYFYFRLIAALGVGVAVTVVRLSVAVPLVASVLVWQEQPGPGQTLGVALVLVALGLFGRPPRSLSLRGVLPVIVAAFVVTGFAQLGSKGFNELHSPAEKPAYLAIVFAAATAGCLVPLAWQRLRPSREDLALGALLGGLNLVQNVALLLALERLPGVVVFPIASGGGVTLAALAGVLVWRERLQRTTLLGIAIAVVALVLVGRGR